MPWADFFTLMAQLLIAAVVVFVISAIVVAIYRGMRDK